MTSIEASKKLAAERAVDTHVKDGNVVGIGSGSTVVYAVHRLAQRVREENLKVHCIPTRFYYSLTQLFLLHLSLSKWTLQGPCKK